MFIYPPSQVVYKGNKPISFNCYLSFTQKQFLSLCNHTFTSQGLFALMTYFISIRITINNFKSFENYDKLTIISPLRE